MARWSAAGILVTYLVLTDGDADGFDPAVPRADIPRIRRSAQQAAARILDVRFLGLAEGTIVQGVERRLPRRRQRLRPPHSARSRGTEAVDRGGDLDAERDRAQPLC
ncbi:MAG: PIG-L deacetylase family protein [Pseudonocardiaceae bacterium]